MSLHIFANVVTPFGTAANNRAETDGNLTTLQKLIWQGETRSTVSAEAIRFALRRLLSCSEEGGSHRSWDENQRRNIWNSGGKINEEFAKWSDDGYRGYIDDDLLGFMAAEAGKEEAEETEADGTAEAAVEVAAERKPKRPRGTATTRRSPLEITRAISLTAWAGDLTFNAASPMATPSAAKKGEAYPVPYGTEVHATRYQYGIALTPDRLRDKSRAAKGIEALCSLGTVAGNHGRFLFDFSPDVIVFRITADPAPRLLYCFDTPDEGKTVTADAIVKRIESGDIDKIELVLGCADLSSPVVAELKRVGVEAIGVKAAWAEAVKQINAKLDLTR